MSNQVNDKILEDLGERIANIEGNLSENNLAEFDYYVKNGQIQDAIELVTYWENSLPEMLDGRYRAYDRETGQVE